MSAHAISDQRTAGGALDAGAASVLPCDGPRQAPAATVGHVDIHPDRGRHSVRNGLLAGAAMALFYVAVVRGASGSWGHLASQVRSDWYLLLIVITGFGVQVGLLSELRRRQRLHAVDAAAGGAGAGAATAGMIACCAHHLADLLPFVGLAGAATFLYDYRLAFVSVGVTVNATAIFLIARRLHAEPSPGLHEAGASCAA